MSSNNFAAGKRMHHLDFLRALMLLLIVITHAANFYHPNIDWIVSSPEKSALSAMLASIPVFSMVGFFIISSMLSMFLMRKRSVDDWAIGRLQRIGIPFVVGVLVLSPVTILFASKAAQIGVNDQAIYLGDLASDFQIVDGRWIGHLWFLSTMGVFTFAAWVAFTKGWMMPFLRSASQRLVDLNAKFSAWWIVVLGLAFWRFGTRVAFYLLQDQPWIDPGLLSVTNASSLVEFFPIFILGLMLGVSADLREQLFGVTKFRAWAIGIVFAAYFLGAPIDERVWGIARIFLGYCLGTGIAFFLIGYLADKFERPNAVIASISKLSYSVYLLHYPIVNGVGYYFLFVSLDPTLEFILVTAITYGLSFSGAWLVDRSGILKFLLNGEPFWQTQKPAGKVASDPNHKTS